VGNAGAEFGVSVLPHARGRGFGARLFEHAALHAGNRQAHQIFIHALSENKAMLRIAIKAGAKVKRHGCDAEAFLQIPARSLKSRLSAFVIERLAQADYRLKQYRQRIPRLSPPLHLGRSSEAVEPV
jgi:RimJ/RimL family protein N-acetyltransferase